MMRLARRAAALAAIDPSLLYGQPQPPNVMPFDPRQGHQPSIMPIDPRGPAYGTMPIDPREGGPTYGPMPIDPRVAKPPMPLYHPGQYAYAPPPQVTTQPFDPRQRRPVYHPGQYSR
jgi:hypothetical protein